MKASMLFYLSVCSLILAILILRWVFNTKSTEKKSAEYFNHRNTLFIKIDIIIMIKFNYNTQSN